MLINLQDFNRVSHRLQIPCLLECYPLRFFNEFAIATYYLGFSPHLLLPMYCAELLMDTRTLKNFG